MNEYYIKILILLVKEPNLSSVAEKLRTSQSNLSKILKKMEEEWGVELFQRKGFKGLFPTESALQLAQIGSQLSKEWSSGLNLIKNKTDARPELRVIGPQMWVQNFFIPYWFSSTWHQQIRLVMTISSLRELNLRSVGGNFDIIISNQSTFLEEYISKKIYREKFYLVFNKKYAPENLEALQPEKYRWLAYRAESDPMKQFLESQKIGFDYIYSYISDLHILLNLVSTKTNFAACLPDHLYELNKSHLVGFEFSVKESLDIFMMYKKKNEETLQILTGLSEFVKARLL